MGQQAFGKSTLEKLHKETDHEIVAVYCAPDKEGKPLEPVKEYALSENLSVFQPSNFKDKEVLEQIKSHNADLCVMAYVIIFVPEEARDIPKHGSICFHPSLLPLHRGPSSINWPIIMGAKKTGLTIFYPNDGLDEGEILLQKEVEIGEDETLGDVYFSKIFPLGVDACVEAANLLDAGNAPKIAQDDTKSTYESWCRKVDARIDWKQSANYIVRHIRAYNSYPGAYFCLGDECIKCWMAVSSNHQSPIPGKIIKITKSGIEVACGQGSLVMEVVQRPGKNKVTAIEYSRQVDFEGHDFT